MDYLDYYWTTIKQIKPGTKFKLHPEHVQESTRGYYDRSRKLFECEYKRPCYTGWKFLAGSEIVCVMKEVTE